MSRNVYTITKCETETGDTADRLRFGKYDAYVTDAADEDGNTVLSGYSTSLNDIASGSSKVPYEDMSSWRSACATYIKEYNEKLSNADVKFDLIDKLDNGLFEFDKYVDDSLVVSHGSGGYLDLKRKNDKDAWKEAVSQYNSDHGIESPIDRAHKKVQKVRDAIAAQDVQFPDEMSLTPPMIETLVAEVASGFSDPCQFVEKLMQAVSVGIPKSNPGLIKETFNYEKKAIKFNAKLKVQKACNALGNIVTAVADPVLGKVDSALDNYEELTYSYEEAQKRMADAIGEYDKWMSEIEPVTFTYTEEEIKEALFRLQQSVSTDSAINVKPLPAPNDREVDYAEYEKIIRESGLSDWLKSPIETYTRMSSGYVMRQLPSENAPRMHRGVDLAAVVGTKLYAMADGKVIQAVYPDRLDNDYGGARIIIEHKTSKLYTMYCHMSRVDVKIGDTVKCGDMVGLSGNSGPKGHSTGPHLHLSVGHTRGNWDINAEEFLYTLAQI